MQAPKDNLIMVMVTCTSEEEALEISNLLVQRRLGACVNIIPVRSIYEWKGRLEDQQERLLIIKTQKERFDELRQTIKSAHSYDIPEIIAVDISLSSPEYAEWVKSCVSKEDNSQFPKGNGK
jgi:periplasmic divalent cation tolerance protein